MVKSLAVEPACTRYGPSREAQLRSDLERSERTSDFVQVNDVSELSLRADGTVGAGGLRFTSWALYQMAQVICPGLYKVLGQLCHDGDRDARMAAIMTFNQILRLKFRDRVSGQMLLVNRPTGTIEAVVTPRFRTLPNSELYRRAAEVMCRAEGSVKFCEAEVAGRWFLCRFVAVEQKVSHGGHDYHCGYHFSNHEGGHASLRACPMVVRRRKKLGLLLPVTRDRHVRHSGNRFGERLQALFDRVLDRPLRLEAVARGLESLAARSLGLGLASEEAEDRRRKELQYQVSARGLTKAVSARIIGNALVQPYDQDEARSLLGMTSGDFASRTALDLMTAACREARAYPINVREQVEQLAYSLVSGVFKLK